MNSANRQRSGSTAGVVDLDLTAEGMDGATPVAEVPPTVNSLDQLLSPTTGERPLNTGSGPENGKRESVVDSGVAVDLDDDVRFSNVPLSAKESHNSQTSSSSLDRRSTMSFGKSSRSSMVNAKGHRKSLSTHTVGSSPRVSEQFLLHRLDKQKSTDDSTDAKRASTHGQQRLQEEFSKLQNGHTAKQPQTDGSSDDDESLIDWDFWGIVIADYRQFASENPQKLAKAIEHGIPRTLRGMVWQLMSASKDPELETTYLNLLKESSAHEKAILRDLGRTFPQHDYFTDGQGIGQENLFNVLKAYSLYDPEVGYCQGLPFVVAILLLNMPDEEAFCLLVRLMYSYGLRGHFLPEMPGLQLRMYQFDRLVEELLPVLHVHFLRQGIKSSMFCSQWFLTMFSYRFPLDIVFRIYDNVLASGVEAIFSFSVILLQKNEEALLKLKFDDILTFLKNRLFEDYVVPGAILPPDSHRLSVALGNDTELNVVYKVDQFVQDSMTVKITPFMLDSYAHEYEDLVKTREAHLMEMDTIRNANRQLTSQVKSLETSLATLNEEHCEIVKDLVHMRIKNEELENELVRYKLLYAEAMHQNEDALSSHRMSSFSTRSSKRSQSQRESST